MNQPQKTSAERYVNGDVTEAEFYKIKGFIAIVYDAPKEDLMMVVNASCACQREEFIKALVVKYLMDKN